MADPEYTPPVFKGTLDYDPEAEVVEDELFEQWLEGTEQRERAMEEDVRGLFANTTECEFSIEPNTTLEGGGRGSVVTERGRSFMTDLFQIIGEEVRCAEEDCRLVCRFIKAERPVLAVVEFNGSIVSLGGGRRWMPYTPLLTPRELNFEGRTRRGHDRIAERSGDTTFEAHYTIADCQSSGD